MRNTSRVYTLSIALVTDALISGCASVGQIGITASCVSTGYAYTSCYRVIQCRRTIPVNAVADGVGWIDGGTADYCLETN